MTVTALVTLCEIIENGSDRFRLSAYPPDDIAELVRAGLVVQDGVVESVPCGNCDICHIATIQRQESTGAWGYRCPEAGFIPVPPDEIAAGRVAMEQIVRALAEGLHVFQPVQADFGKTVLPLGKFDLKAVDCFAYLAMRISSAGDYMAIRAEIDRRPRPGFGVVLMSVREAPTPLQLPRSHLMIPLIEIASWDDSDGIQISRASIARYIPGTGEISKGGRPPKVEETWRVVADLIDKRLVLKVEEATWPMVRDHSQELFPGLEPPKRTTVLGHLRQLKPDIEQALREKSRGDEN